MHEYICLQCGMPITSKCVKRRSVFVRNEMDALLSHVMKFQLDRAEPDPECPAFKVSVRLVITLEDRAAPAQSDYDVALEMWRSLADRLQRMTDPDDGLGYPSLEQWACTHDELAILDDRCLFGCCMRKPWHELAGRCVELGNYQLAVRFCLEALKQGEDGAEERLREVCAAAGLEAEEFLAEYIDPGWQRAMAEGLNRLPMSTRARRALLRNLGINGADHVYDHPHAAFLVAGQQRPFGEWATAVLRGEVDLTALLGRHRVGPKTLDELREALALYDAQQYERQSLRYDLVYEE